jgi:hypothetical protein
VIEEVRRLIPKRPIDASNPWGGADRKRLNGLLALHLPALLDAAERADGLAELVRLLVEDEEWEYDAESGVRIVHLDDTSTPLAETRPDLAALVSAALLRRTLDEAGSDAGDDDRHEFYRQPGALNCVVCGHLEGDATYHLGTGPAPLDEAGSDDV